MVKLIVKTYLTAMLFACSILHNAWANINKSWRLGIVSQEITGLNADSDTYENIENFFSNRPITINSNVLYVKGEFSCEVMFQKRHPIEYWQSERSVSFYRDLLSKYNIKLDDPIDVIMPVNADSQCQFPFSEFIHTDNSLMLVYKDHAAWYFPEGDLRLNKKKIQVLPQTRKKISDKNCLETSNEVNTVYLQGYTVTCFYPETDLISTYIKYRDENKSDQALGILEEEVTLLQNKQVEISPDFFFDYQWKSRNQLDVIIFQPGGVTTLSFRQEADGTTVRNTSSPD